MRDLTIGSLAEFELALRAVAERHCVFRGEDATGYPLRPRVGRVEHAADVSPTEQQLLEEFKALAQPRLPITPTDDWEWLALAQRHGLATRLLDWTPNPLVAAFWAIQEPHRGGDRVLYVLDCDGMPTGPIRGASPFDVRAVTLYRPARIGPRLLAQCGAFTVHPDPTASFESAGLERWVLDHRTLTGLCLTVDGLGTSDEAVFLCDLDFVCRKLNWDWEIETLADGVPIARSGVTQGDAPPTPARREFHGSP